MRASIAKSTNVNSTKKIIRQPYIRVFWGIVVVSIIFVAMRAQAASQLMDYYKPTPIIGPLSSTCWGAAQVGPRDQSNGLEDKTLANYVYWDGSIIKGPDSTYHLFCSRWDQTNGHTGWMCCSKAVHATSKNLYGPYTDKGLAFTENDGAGHNVGILQLKTGDPAGKQYALTLSGGFGAGSGRMYGANSLDGPWTYLGRISTVSGTSMDVNGNLQIILRPDGKYEAINNSGVTAISDNFLGPYKPQPTFYPGIKGIPNVGRIEDPTIWYSGGKYHWVCNQWDIVKAFHFTSLDGSTNWKLEPGHAYEASTSFVRYTDNTANHWAHYERPRPYLENGHIVAFTFAAINVEKDADKANDQNGSKIIVVPFDGEKFDTDTICASFYPETNYGGIPVALKPGDYTTAQLSSAGIPNNSVSSIWVSGGLTVEIYDNDNFTGAKSTIDSNAASLSSLNDAMSSVKIIDPAVSTTYTTKRSFTGVTGGQNMKSGSRNVTTYDLSGRIVGNRTQMKSGIYLTRKAGHGVQRVFLRKDGPK
jgi:hypothetical protein